MASEKQSEPTPDPSELSFEDAAAQLEEIIERVEGGQIGIEEALREYERGVKLVARCREVLRRTEQRIEELEAEASDERGDNAS